MMKKTKTILSFLLLLAIVAIFASCGKDPEIYGKWKVVGLTVTDGENSQSFDLSQIVTEEITMEFKKDGQYIIAMDDEEAPGEYTLHGNDIVFKDAYTEQIYDSEQGLVVNHYDIAGVINSLTKTDLCIELYPPEQVLASLEIEQEIYVILDFERL